MTRLPGTISLIASLIRVSAPVAAPRCLAASVSPGRVGRFGCRVRVRRRPAGDDSDHRAVDRPVDRPLGILAGLLVAWLAVRAGSPVIEISGGSAGLFESGLTLADVGPDTDLSIFIQDEDIQQAIVNRIGFHDAKAGAHHA